MLKILATIDSRTIDSCNGVLVKSFLAQGVPNWAKRLRIDLVFSEGLLPTWKFLVDIKNRNMHLCLLDCVFEAYRQWPEGMREVVPAEMLDALGIDSVPAKEVLRFDRVLNPLFPFMHPFVRDVFTIVPAKQIPGIWCRMKSAQNHGDQQRRRASIA